MKSIAIILPYFGPFHNYFELWAKSAGNNPTIDFLIFTDNRPIEAAPNVKFFNFSFIHLRELFQSRFDFTISLENPYKICDFRPAFGVIFSDYIKGYDFWGHCDCDLIFGDIREFVSDSILSSYDKIFDWGHLCLYRNEDGLNRMFMQHLDGVRYYRNVFMSNIPQCFDESCGASPIWARMCPSRVYSKWVFDDIDFNRGDLRTTQGLGPCLYEYESGNLTRFVLSDGKIESENICYLHLQKRRMKIIGKGMSDSFIVVPNEFLVREDISTKSFTKYKYRGLYLYPLFIKGKTLLNKVNRRIKNNI